MKPALSTVPTPAPSPLLSPAEAARRLGVKRRTLMSWARRGDLSCVVFARGRDGRATLVAFDPGDLDAFVAAHRQEAAR